MVIGIRYAGVRKQFGPPEGEELPILEYQLLVSLGTESENVVTATM